jgi:hypothetical protein
MTRGLAQLYTTLGELHTLGAGYFERFFSSQEADEYVPKLFDLMERNDLNYTVSFFQQVRTGLNQTFEWYLSASLIVERHMAGQPLLVLTVAQRLYPTLSLLEAACPRR